MSEYATLDDVQRRMPQFQLGPETRPNDQTAADLLASAHAQFDSAMVNLGYVIPITGLRSTAQAKEIVCQGAICTILSARGAAIGTDAAFQSADRACKVYADALALLADPNSPIELSDAERTDEMVDKQGGTTPMGLFPQCPRITMDSKF